MLDTAHDIIPGRQNCCCDSRVLLASATDYMGYAIGCRLADQNNRNSIPNTDHRFVDAGGVLGGPIRHDRTFFMGAYQGFNENIPFPRTSTVPSDLQRLGDFSQTFNSAGQLITIYDPLTTRPDPSRA